MQALWMCLIAICLLSLSSGAAASTRASDTQARELRVGALACTLASVVKTVAPPAKGFAAEDDGTRMEAPGDDGLHPEDLAEPTPRGYCNIWSADLLDPPDVLDEIEESSALIALPPLRFPWLESDIAQGGHGRAPPLPDAVYKPPILLA
ncbi:cobalt-zinc-cadmium resistance protein [Cupriavidus sp. AU9028]|uniref:cobalt-zinc-cadmium resistance protein n=1 Tax=Cupriavidus sp. AU9028 TaxID=2871157 RepID=UPI001C960E18|nr:cobalt-zinc-cadmium resistance protein [Cupriavidus sp. AU9028]MBY4896108.1 cobalt-zinc-cadmium resistance protein [Cupriavidus sp. AU9028]